MQFDLGATYTMFYENTLKPFFEKYPSLKAKVDTTKRNQDNPILQNVDLQLGEVGFKNIGVTLLNNHGYEYLLDSINAETEIRIGTIGADLVQNKVLIIDYQLNRLAITDTLPAEYENASFECSRIEQGRIKIPFKINEKVEDLMFDTGASIFKLTTTKQNASRIGGNQVIDTLTVPSWDGDATLYGLETIAPIMFGDKILESSIVYYSEDTSWDNFYQSENMWGLTGNAYFLNYVIIIDYKNNRFGLK